ncbi:oxidoreductase [Pseudonocardiaceae bacterium YIM PH 21723]|nr:oxidoreductase [Pseudonocardiaceae bacterium YIM PH 21723]
MTEQIVLGGDLSVSRLGFGAMRLGPDLGLPKNPDRDTALRVARRAVELGITFIDTADAYGIGANEELLAEALHPYADDLVIGTKVGNTRPNWDWVPVGRPEYLVQQAELCLRRLRLDRLDLLQLHRIDPKVPLEDQIGALRQLREAGKVRHIGLSEVSVEQLVAAREIAPIVSVQNRYNLADRASDPVLDYCTAEGIAFLPWRPVEAAPAEAVARRIGATASQVSLAWLLRRSPVMLPIPGTSSVEHLEENTAARDITLSDADYQELTER